MVSEHKVTDNFTKKIQDAIDYVHMDEKARIAYMTIGMKIEEERKEAWNEGRLLQLIELVKDGLLNVSDAASRAGMTVDEF